LKPEAVTAIRRDLGAVLRDHPESPVLPTAAVGLIATKVSVGEMARAEADYARVVELSANRPDLLERVRNDLGDVALLVGGIPEFNARSLDGEALGTESFQGRVVVLDFWATWCPPCIEEFPALRKIDRRHGDDVLVLGVNMDDADTLSAEALRDWISQQNVPGVQLHDGLGWDSELVGAFGVKEIPFNVVVAPDGEVVAVNVRGPDLERAVREAKR
jgi:thiol-disulfide isomerase/thioredoxin